MPRSANFWQRKHNRSAAPRSGDFSAVAPFRFGRSTYSAVLVCDLGCDPEAFSGLGFGIICGEFGETVLGIWESGYNVECHVSEGPCVIARRESNPSRTS
jgi:hypothetical protein